MFHIRHTRKINSLFRVPYIYLIKPLSLNPDIARREFILNILLLAIILITLLSFIINLLKFFFISGYHELNPALTGLVLAIFSSLLLISRKGKSRLVSFIFITLLFLFNLSIALYWGPDVPEFLLVLSLIIVMTGILIDSKRAILISLISGLVILVLSLLKTQGILKTDDSWRIEMIHLTDALVYGITLGIISLVSWLFNREMEQALKRARASEQALIKQRDELEITVQKRTRQLISVQAEKIEQIYKFAQFGKSASGLFHDLLSPLTLVSLNLSKLSKSHFSTKEISSTQKALKRAVSGTRRLENYLLAARRQIQNQKIMKSFSLKEEINQVIQVVEHRAKENRVLIKLSAPLIKIVNNPLRFNQLMTNLISNAIESYDNTKKKSRIIEVNLSKNSGEIQIEVKDFGVGIEKKNLSKVFESLYTTKGIEKGTGIGLSICKEIVEKDFKGEIRVESKKSVGSSFKISFPPNHG